MNRRALIRIKDKNVRQAYAGLQHGKTKKAERPVKGAPL